MRLLTSSLSFPSYVRISSVHKAVGFLGITICRILPLGILGVTVFIIMFLVIQSYPSFEVSLDSYLLNSHWQPQEGSYGLLPGLLGSLLVALGACSWAIPLAAGVAVFVKFYSQGIWSKLILAMTEMLAGIPSVVYGILGLTLVVPAIGWIAPPGASLLSGIIVLGLMVFPTVVLFMLVGLSQLPEDQMACVKALGIRPSLAILHIFCFPIMNNLKTATFLAFLRCLGETMVVLMVCGNLPRIPFSLFDPVRTLTAGIALEMGYALEMHRSALYLSGLILVSLTLAIIIIITSLKYRAKNVSMA